MGESERGQWAIGAHVFISCVINSENVHNEKERTEFT